MDPSKPQIVTFALDRRPRATRASGSKVRTGCITCKKRHVKCDEAKPHCMRCLKSKGSCEGYERRTPEPSTAKRLVPKPATPNRLSPSPSSQAGPSQQHLHPLRLNSPQYGTDQESMYFDQWMTISRSMTAGLVPSDFWTRAIPNDSYGEKAVRLAAIAVGAMSSAVLSNMGPKPMSKEELYKSEHYANALAYHADALSLVRQAAPHNGIRTAVVSCILFFVYAAMAEEGETALRHLIHGTMILEQFINNQFGTSFKMMVNHHSSTPFQVEDEIFQVFNRISYNFLAHKYLLRPNACIPGQLFLKQPASLETHQIPAEFSDLVQARRWWDILLAKVGDSARSRLKLTTHCGDWISRPEPTEIKQHGDNLGAMESWHTAFSPLYHRACKTQQDRFDEFIRAIHLEVQFLTHRASACTLSNADYGSMASLTGDFQEIVRLLELVLPYEMQVAMGQHDTILTLDMGHVLSLHLVSMFCRDEIVRYRAMGLLEKYPRRDGLWDSRAVLAMARLNRSVEEENRMEGDVREQWDRISHREINIDTSHHRGTFKAVRRDLDMGGWVIRTETFFW